MGVNIIPMVGLLMKRITIIVLAAFIAACGSDGPVTPASEPVSIVTSNLDAGSTPGMTNVPLDPRAKYWEPLIRSADYTGQIAVMFKESAGVRLNSGSPLSLNPSAGMTIFRSRSNTDIAALNQLFAQHPEAIVQMGLPNITQDELDQRIAEIRVSEGYPMTDWGSFYIVSVTDADEALEVLSGLYQTGPGGKSEKSRLDPLATHCGGGGSDISSAPPGQLPAASVARPSGDSSTSGVIATKSTGDYWSMYG